MMAELRIINTRTERLEKAVGVSDWLGFPIEISGKNAKTANHEEIAESPAPCGPHVCAAAFNNT